MIAENNDPGTRSIGKVERARRLAEGGHPLVRVNQRRPGAVFMHIVAHILVLTGGNQRIGVVAVAFRQGEAIAVAIGLRVARIRSGLGACTTHPRGQYPRRQVGHGSTPM